MGDDSPPTLEAFRGFFERYREACRNRDTAFLRRMLPPDIPDDEFAFVVESAHELAVGLDESGVEPRFERTGNRFEAVLRIEEGGDVEAWRLDFYASGDGFLKYDPGSPGAPV